MIEVVSWSPVVVDEVVWVVLSDWGVMDFSGMGDAQFLLELDVADEVVLSTCMLKELRATK